MSHYLIVLAFERHRDRFAPLRLMPNWRSLSNTLLLGYESGILLTCPSHRILLAFATVRMLRSSYSSAPATCSGGCVAQTRSEHLQPPLAWSKSRVRRGSPAESLCDISHSSFGLEGYWLSTDGEYHSINNSPTQSVSEFRY